MESKFFSVTILELDHLQEAIYLIELFVEMSQCKEKWFFSKKKEHGYLFEKPN